MAWFVYFGKTWKAGLNMSILLLFFYTEIVTIDVL